MPAKSVLSALPYSALESLWGPRRSECRCGRVPDGLVKQSTPAGLDPLPCRSAPALGSPHSRGGACHGSGVDPSQRAHCPSGPRSGCSTPSPRTAFGARPTAPCCEIRFLVLHTYPDGIKAYGHERITTPIGRRGKPVKKLRLIPAESAYAMARYFQGLRQH